MGGKRKGGEGEEEREGRGSLVRGGARPPNIVA